MTALHVTLTALHVTALTQTLPVHDRHSRTSSQISGGGATGHWVSTSTYTLAHLFNGAFAL